MKNSKFIIAALVLVAVAGLAVAQKVSIDFRFNTEAADAKNHFNWSANGKSVKDGFDAATGASIARSTTAFNVVRYDNDATKKNAIPAGLRALVLYPVAAWNTATSDAFTVTANGKQLVIRFIHRGTAYQVTTDNKGKIDTDDSFKIAAGVGENVGGKFLIKDEFLKDGGDKANMADLDWSKITLVDDEAAEDATVDYDGELTASLKKGILTIKGNLKAD